MSPLPLTPSFDLQNKVFARGFIGTVVFAAVLGLFWPESAAAKGTAKPDAVRHSSAAHAHPHHTNHHHRGGYHRGGYHRVSIYNVGYFRGYHRTGYYRHRGYGYNRQQAWMSRMYQQQYQMMMKQRQAEARAFMATFDLNHNGTIEGKERGPAEHYLRERRLGKVPALSITGQTRVKG